jgi:TetR/AcrR family transcriptional repressor of nem operon
MDTPIESPRVRDPEKTRERILDGAQALILDFGFGATTVDAVVKRAGITKGAFFHHFASKTDLAHALVRRFAQQDREVLESQLARAGRLATDPLQQVLLLIGFYEEGFEAAGDSAPAGCLFASYIYENKLFDPETIDILKASTLLWREVMLGKLRQVVAVHPPRQAVDLESLADLFYSITEGAYVMTKTLGDRTLLPRQAAHLRTYLTLLFAPPESTATPPRAS